MLNSIQALRGIAAWLVVFHHYVQIFHENESKGLISTFFWEHGAIGVDIFFIISGFVIYLSTFNKTTSAKHFIVGRLSRIVPAYWFFSVAIALSFLIQPEIIKFTEFESIFLLKSLFFIPAQNPSGIGIFPLLTVGWTLNYEIAFYILFIPALGLPLKNKGIIFISTMILFKIALFNKNGDFTFYNNNIMFEFLLGSLLAIIHTKKIFIFNISIPITCGIGAIILLAVSGPVSHNVLRNGIPSLLIVYAFISLEKSFKSDGILSFFGNISYSTYLSHVLILFLFFEAQKKLGFNEVTTVILTSCLTILISWLSYMYIEKPASENLKRFFTISNKKADKLEKNIQITDTRSL